MSDILIKTNEFVFSYRVAAILINNGKILLQKPINEIGFAFPGGHGYIVFLYKTSDYSGELIAECDEGKHFWMTIEEFRNTPSDNGTPKYLPMYLENKYSEAFGVWNDEKEWDIVYK